jgi:hypothetical protein
MRAFWILSTTITFGAFVSSQSPCPYNRTCMVFPIQRGFEIQKVDGHRLPCLSDCGSSSSHHHRRDCDSSSSHHHHHRDCDSSSSHHHHHRDCDSSSSHHHHHRDRDSSSSHHHHHHDCGCLRCKPPCLPLCTFYYTSCPKDICGPYIPLDLIAPAQTILLNFRDFYRLASLYDAYNFRSQLSLNTDPTALLKFISVCPFLKFLRNLGKTGGIFSSTTDTIVAGPEVALLVGTFSYFNGTDPFTGSLIPPVTYQVESTLIRDACNNWVFTLENFILLV